MSGILRTIGLDQLCVADDMKAYMDKLYKQLADAPYRKAMRKNWNCQHSE
jgi:hypothetical protein